MNREFIRAQSFDKQWSALGFSELDMHSLENLLLDDSRVGDVIRGTNGARKLRIPATDHGKRGGARIIYLDLPEREKIYFITIYAKNQTTDISPEQKKLIADLVTRLKGVL